MIDKKEVEVEKKDKKLDVENAEKFILDGLSEIRGLSATNGVKTKKEKRLATSAMIILAGRISRKHNVASLSYLNRKVTYLRKVVRLEGFVHHAFFSNLESILEKHPLAKKEINSLMNKEYLELKEELISKAIKSLKARANRSTKKENKKSLASAAIKINKLKLDPVFLETFKRTIEQKNELKKAADERIEKYHTNQREFSYYKAYNVVAEALASQADWELLAFGLALASGRRSTEVVCYLEGEFKKGKAKKEAIFTSHLKTKKAKTFTIPLLVDFDIFMDSLTRFRDLYRIKTLIDRAVEIDNPDKRQDAINSSIQEQLSWRSKEIMEGRKLPRPKKGENKKDISPWDFNDSRALYARITYAEYVAKCKKDGKIPVADDYFFKQKLGHTDATTQQNYKQFSISGLENLDHAEVTERKKEANKVAANVRNRHKELQKLLKCKEVQDDKSYLKYADWVLDQVKRDPSIKISANVIQGTAKRNSDGTLVKVDGKTVMESGVGGNKGKILKFVKLLGDLKEAI